jgi:ribosomal protein S18 acetylase RimI-like enzyme
LGVTDELSVDYELERASESSRTWLDDLRRHAYFDLLVAIFGGWDEDRHRRHCDDCWGRGEISLVVVSGARVGMIQVFERPGEVQIGEIQIHPDHQNQGIGTRLLEDVIAMAERQGKDVKLAVGLENERAYRLYQRLGFRCMAQSDTHHHLQRPPGQGDV